MVPSIANPWTESGRQILPFLKMFSYLISFLPVLPGRLRTFIGCCAINVNAFKQPRAVAGGPTGNSVWQDRSLIAALKILTVQETIFHLIVQITYKKRKTFLPKFRFQSVFVNEKKRMGGNPRKRQFIKWGFYLHHFWLTFFFFVYFWNPVFFTQLSYHLKLVASKATIKMMTTKQARLQRHQYFLACILKSNPTVWCVRIFCIRLIVRRFLIVFLFSLCWLSSVIMQKKWLC